MNFQQTTITFQYTEYISMAGYAIKSLMIPIGYRSTCSL
jgi:hypothetical protein